MAALVDGGARRFDNLISRGMGAREAAGEAEGCFRGAGYRCDAGHGPALTTCRRDARSADAYRVADGKAATDLDYDRSCAGGGVSPELAAAVPGAEAEGEAGASAEAIGGT